MESIAAANLDLSLLGRLIVMVDDSELGYLVTIRNRRDRIIEFTHCDDDVSFDVSGVPF